jgi:hypothetical protein
VSAQMQTDHPVAIVATPLLLIGGIVATLFGTSQALSTPQDEDRLVVDDCIIVNPSPFVDLRKVELLEFEEVRLLEPIGEIVVYGGVVLGVPMAQQKEIERAWTECRK